MTFRLPREKPCSLNSASAAATTAARRLGSTRAQVTVGIWILPGVDDHWSYYCEPGHGQGSARTNNPLFRVSAGQHHAAGDRSTAGCGHSHLGPPGQLPV